MYRPSRYGITRRYVVPNVTPSPSRSPYDRCRGIYQVAPQRGPFYPPDSPPARLEGTMSLPRSDGNTTEKRSGLPFRDMLIVLTCAIGLRLGFALLTADTYDYDEFVIL